LRSKTNFFGRIFNQPSITGVNTIGGIAVHNMTQVNSRRDSRIPVPGWNPKADAPK
jgi:hypothetical protein